jgi:hypothetical protein
VSDTFESAKSLPLAEERISLQKRTVETGRVRIRTVIDERQQWARESLARENVLSSVCLSVPRSSQNNAEGLKNAVLELWRLMPTEAVEEAQRGYQSGIVKGRA